MNELKAGKSGELGDKHRLSCRGQKKNIHFNCMLNVLSVGTL